MWLRKSKQRRESKRSPRAMRVKAVLVDRSPRRCRSLALEFSTRRRKPPKLARRSTMKLRDCAAGANNEEIERARADFREFSKSHAGVLEADYLSGFKDARVVAPNELYEMAQLGARYRTSLRNSGLSASEYDVGNVMRMMDELGLKTQAERERFLNATLKNPAGLWVSDFDRDHALRVP